MDTNALLTLVNSTIDKIFAMATRYGVTLSLGKEQLKQSVKDAAMRPKDDTRVYDFALITEQGTDKDQFKQEFMRAMQNLISLLNRYGLSINKKAIINALATITLEENTTMNDVTCPNCKVQFQDNGSHMCPMCKYQMPEVDADASVNALGATPSGPLRKGVVTAHEVLEMCEGCDVK